MDKKPVTASAWTHGLCSAALGLCALVIIAWCLSSGEGRLDVPPGTFNLKTYIPIPVCVIMGLILPLWWRTRGKE